MMNLKFDIDEIYDGFQYIEDLEYVELEAEDDKEADMLHNLCASEKLEIENPARTFGRKLRNGEFEGESDEEIAKYAEIANHLAKFFRKNGILVDGEDYDCTMPSINIFTLLTRILTAYLRDEYSYEKNEDSKKIKEEIQKVLCRF